ncbi:paraquat-inducible protein A [Paraglaciecola psychrophila]|jgi:paraquat-inducible protein A|uniref:PqiA family integral membrane protein n=1 Tax=Paraglaciecola psychrophila 170 TaxID=1129794 RepID=K7A5K9_9ALTE|nr:PqiA family integral membrane protein [Paraglaciecola psychrophila 170]GAC36123.1 paraquat-inducible protein A [Paraglaciecola psychrophila 170]
MLFNKPANIYHIRNPKPSETIETKTIISKPQTILCHECHFRVKLPSLTHKQAAVCPRCGLQLTVYHHHASQRIIALAATSLIFLLTSLPFEFLSFSISGQYTSIDILGGLWVLVEKDYGLLALVQVLAILILPAFVLMSLLYLLVPFSLGFRPKKAEWVIKTLFNLLPWTMAEIFLIGVLVSLIKILSMADIGLGLSFYAYLFFTIFMTITLLYVDKYQLKLLLNVEVKDRKTPTNPSKSIQTTWALLFTSVLLYIPANILPIMHTSVLGSDDPSTILGGVILLWQMGSYPIAIVIFIASVFIPVAKIVILCWLNYSVQSKQQRANSERIFWYRITEFVGRWSMIDVFVVAVLVSLIQLGNIINVLPGHAALAFCGVVICTMLAAMSFDSRLIWCETEKLKGGERPL